MDETKEGFTFTLGNNTTLRERYQEDEGSHDIVSGEMNFFSSIILPLFTVLLATTCLVVAFWESKYFTKQSYAKLYLIISSAVLFIDFIFVLAESLLAKRVVSLTWEKFQKFSIIFLLVSYVFLSIFGSILISNVNEQIKFSKDSAPISLAFIAVYCFILCRTLIEAGSFAAFWMFQFFKKTKKDSFGKVLDNEEATMDKTENPSSPTKDVTNDNSLLWEEDVSIFVP